jgi:hypothetical protein
MTKPGVAFESLLAALAQLFLGSLLPSGLVAYPVSLNRGAVCEGLAMARRTKKAGGSRRGQEVLPEVGRGILTRVNADGLRALKILAVERDMTLQALGVEALNDMLVKHGKRPVVKNPLL